MVETTGCARPGRRPRRWPRRRLAASLALPTHRVALGTGSMRQQSIDVAAGARRSARACMRARERELASYVGWLKRGERASSVGQHARQLRHSCMHATICMGCPCHEAGCTCMVADGAETAQLAVWIIYTITMATHSIAFEWSRRRCRAVQRACIRAFKYNMSRRVSCSELCSARPRRSA